MSFMIMFLASALVLPVGMSYAQNAVTASTPSIQTMNNQTGTMSHGMNQTAMPHGMNQTAIPANSAVSQHVTTPKMLAPLQQVKSGVAPKDVQCKQGFKLVIKAEDGSPACVDPNLSQILFQRGWSVTS